MVFMGGELERARSARSSSPFYPLITCHFDRKNEAKRSAEGRNLLALCTVELDKSWFIYLQEAVVKYPKQKTTNNKNCILSEAKLSFRNREQKTDNSPGTGVSFAN